MTPPKKTTQVDTEPLTAVEVGRYLKRLAHLNKDRKTGNLALSIALQELAKYLIESKKKSVREVFAQHPDQVELDFDETATKHIDALSLAEISNLFENQNVPRTKLIAIGFKRFGIPQSKLSKVSKEAVIKTIRSALEHEKSIEILSDEASRGGKNRTS